MDLKQIKLSKSEWDGIEIPVSNSESDIVNRVEIKLPPALSQNFGAETQIIGTKNNRFIIMAAVGVFL